MELMVEEYIEEYINLGLDVDGTLTEQRIGDVTVLSTKELAKKYSECTLKKGVDILLEKKLDLGFNIYIITGRRESHREVTIDWLNMYGIPYNELVMVPDDFYAIGGFNVEKYVGFKLEAHIKRNIRYSLDDNISVVNALNEEGVYACKVDNNFKEAFDKVFTGRR